MGDLEAHAGLFGDADRLIERFDQEIALIAHVTGINPAQLSHDLGQFGDFVSLGKTAGRVFQSGRHPESAVLDIFGDQRFHFFHLFRFRRPVIEPHRGPADGPLSDEGRIIEGHPFLLEPGKKARDVPPGQVHVVLFFKGFFLFLEYLVGNGERR